MPSEQEVGAEATEFAMELLMPTAFLRRDLADGIDIGDDDAISKLAKKYKVDKTMMALRIGQLMVRKAAERVREGK